MPKGQSSTDLHVGRCPKCRVEYLWSGGPALAEPRCPKCGEGLHTVMTARLDQSWPVAPGKPLAMRRNVSGAPAADKPEES